jgi:hypothetical protein
MYQAVLQWPADETRASRLTFVLSPSDTIHSLLDAITPHRWHGDVTIYDLENLESVATVKRAVGYL